MRIDESSTVVPVQQSRPVGAIVAAASSVTLGLVFLIFAGVSAGSGHGIFSIQIGALLAAYGLLLIGSAIGLWLRKMWSRGPVAAFSLMAGFGFGEYLKDSPWMWALVAICLAAVAGVVLPSTTRWLARKVSSADPPPQPGGPRKWRERFGRNPGTPG